MKRRKRDYTRRFNICTNGYCPHRKGCRRAYLIPGHEPIHKRLTPDTCGESPGD